MTLEELYKELKKCPERFDRVYLHWTAGDYDSIFDDYHLSITGDGHLINNLSLDAPPAATWHRNNRSIAIALCCGKGATLYSSYTDFGDYPPTEEQVECLAQVVATISNATALPIVKGLFMTHAEIAEIDEYGPTTTCERWDLWTLPQSEEWGSGGDYIRGKALWYQKQWSE